MIYLRQVAPPGVSTVPGDTLFSVHCSLSFLLTAHARVLYIMHSNRKEAIKMQHSVRSDMSWWMRLQCCSSFQFDLFTVVMINFHAVMLCSGCISLSLCSLMRLWSKRSLHAYILALNLGGWLDDILYNLSVRRHGATGKHFTPACLRFFWNRKGHKYPANQLYKLYTIVNWLKLAVSFVYTHLENNYMTFQFQFYWVCCS